MNSKLWRSGHSQGQGLILVESAAGAPSALTFAYVSNALASLLDSEIVAFTASKTVLRHLSPTLFWIGYRLFWSLLSERAKIYRTFGAKRYIHPWRSRKRSEEARKVVDDFYRDTPDKRDLERMVVRGVVVGDLLYDTYCRREGLPTVDLDSRRFRDWVTAWVEEALFWSDMVSMGKISAIVVSHSVYNLAVPLRMVLSSGGLGFQVGGGGYKRLTADRPRPEDFYRDFPLKFAELSKSQQQRGIREAQKRVELRFAGAVGVDQSYQTFSPFGQKTPTQLLRNSAAPKILVATHCFSDATHYLGENLFPDFWEWMVFLGRLSERTDFDWYLKPHPDCHQRNSAAIDELMSKFPRFSSLPLEASHHQLVEEGITVVLTVYGSVGFEYAALGVPVINASPNNLHAGYSFNFHPTTVSEYENLILSAATLRKPGKRERREVLEYYYMNHIHSAEVNPFGLDFREHRRRFLQEKGYRDDSLLGNFVDIWSETSHQRVLEEFKSRLVSDLDEYYADGAVR